jgi:hypothetical protein
VQGVDAVRNLLPTARALPVYPTTDQQLGGLISQVLATDRAPVLFGRVDPWRDTPTARTDALARTDPALRLLLAVGDWPLAAGQVYLIDPLGNVICTVRRDSRRFRCRRLSQTCRAWVLTWWT